LFTTIVNGNIVTSVLNGTTATSSGIKVPVAGYYEVSGAITFSSSNALPYVSPGAATNATTIITVNDVQQTNGNAIAVETSTNSYTSFATDIVEITNTTYAISLAALGSSSLYIWGIGEEISTLGTASINSYILSVESSTGIIEGMLVAGTGIASNAVVTSVLGNLIGISIMTTAALSSTAVTFTAQGYETYMSVFYLGN
jgi:hypothetical protein